jgi:uncharacterized membrane protein
MRRIWTIVLLVALVLLGGQVRPLTALAQGGQGASEGLIIFTRYPAQVAEIGETVTFNLTLRNTGSSPQTVRLDMQEAPEGWTATFRGGGDIVQAVYVEPGEDASVSLKLEPPEDVSGGTYRFVVIARGEGVEAELPLELTVKEKLPPQLELEVELPTLRGTSNTTFRYDVTLRNEGDEDLTVGLEAEAPRGFLVSFKFRGKEVTSLPLKANDSERLNIEVEPFIEMPAGQYQVTVRAQGAEAEASLTLTAEVTGQPKLSITAPDGRLSGQAYAGRETPLKIIVQNTGTAPARGVELSASEPSGWSVEFDPKEIAEIPAGTQVEATAKIRPAEKAVAGDYMVTIRARPEEGTSESAEFRITVLTPTLWGVVGIAVIAVAVIVVGLAVVRFGRR